MSPAKPRSRMGRVEAAVHRDLAALGSAGKSTLAELALVLARTVDQRGMDEGPSTTVRLISELRVTLNQLREVARDSGDGDEDGLPAPAWDEPTPVRDPPHPRPADAGPAGGGGRQTAG